MKHGKNFLGTLAFLLGLLTMPLGHSRGAMADQNYAVVHIMCAPEVGYFSIRRFLLINLRYESDSQIMTVLAQAASAQGIYSPFLLKSKPFECDLPGAASAPDQPERKQLQLRVEAVYDAQQRRASSRDFITKIEAAANGRLLDSIFLDLAAYSAPNTIDLIEVTFNGADFWLRKCAYGEYQEPNTKRRSCTNEKL